jgi:hypothetical protein
MRTLFKRTETYKFSEFMSGEYKYPKRNKTPNKRNLTALTTGALIPLAVVPKVLAAEPVNTCGEAISVITSSAPQAIPVAASDVIGREIIAAMAHLFDPIIDIIIGISFPVASAMILWKIFMSFFRDSGDTWEGVGKVALTYCIIQMFPVLIKILKSLGTIAVGI